MKYTLIRSKKRKRSVSIKINASKEVIVRAPFSLNKKAIDKFVHKHHDWISKSIKNFKQSPCKKRLNVTDFTHKKKLLAKYLNRSLPLISNKMNMHYKDYNIKNVTSYWGRCSPDNSIAFNCNLINFPQATIDYVIIHELCHTKVKGHNKKFWSLVEKYSPDYRKHKQLLKTGGSKIE